MSIESKFCSECGAPLGVDDLFCPVCGAKDSNLKDRSANIPTTNKMTNSPPPNLGRVKHNSAPPPPYSNKRRQSTSNTKQPKTPMYASFPSRLGVLFIDWVFLQLISIVLLATGESMGIIDQINSQAEEILLVVLLVSVLIFTWLYHAGLEASHLQGTIGNLVLGLKVTDEEGKRCTLGCTTARFFGKFLSAFLFGFGYIMIAFTKRKQGLHDILAKTLVVKK